jgi:transposase InsO family protein
MQERLSFVQEVKRGTRSMSDLCRLFGISRKSGYKWLARYEEGGVSALSDRSRAAHMHPNAMDQTAAALLLALRARHPDWGPQKLLVYLARQQPRLPLPAISTVAALLKRHDLIKPRRARRRTAPYSAPFIQAGAPNELWSADFKGQFRLLDARYCYPLTISDSYSRYLIACRALPHARFALVKPWFERAFREFGLPSAIRTDNGAPFASTAIGGLSRLSVWWLKLGILPERIRVGHPEQNGRHERLHATMKRACPIRASLPAQQRAFERFRSDYNELRPHRALADRTPASVYRPSQRAFPRRTPKLQYPEGFAVRRVAPNGHFTWHCREYYVGNVLIGEPLGLFPVAEGRWRIHVGMLAVAELDLRIQRIEPIDVLINPPTLH